jgi:multiple sugar transport system substrate-binding protein
MKRILSMLGSALVILAAGCGGGSDGSGRSDGKLVVHFWHAMGGPLGQVLTSLIDEFNAAHPAWLIKPESMGSYEALKQKLLASIIARNQPDMSQAYEAWISTLIGGNALVDLKTLDPGFDKDLQDFYPVFIEDSLYDGKLFSLPFNKSVPVIYYNKEMFQRAGLDPAKPPETWEEFVRFSRLLTRDLDGDGLPDQWGHKFTDHATYFECLLAQNGGALYDDKTRTLLFDSPEGREAVEFLVNLVRQDRSADFYLGGYEHQVDFAAEKVAMIVASCVSRTFMQKQIKFAWGMAPLLSRKRRASLVYGTNIVVFARSSPEKQQAAWEFIKWFTSPSVSARWCLSTNYVPVRRSALDLPVMKEAIAKSPDTAVPIRELEFGFFEPRIDEWLRIREYLGDAVKAALLGKLDPEASLKRATAKGNLWLK